jgi:hypothetical protein
MTNRIDWQRIGGRSWRVTITRGWDEARTAWQNLQAQNINPGQLGMLQQAMNIPSPVQMLGYGLGGPCPCCGRSYAGYCEHRGPFNSSLLGL